MVWSNGNIFRVTGPLWGEFTGHRWIPLTKASDAELWCFLWSKPWINDRVINRKAGDFRRHHAHYDVIVMCCGNIKWSFSGQIRLFCRENDITRHGACMIKDWVLSYLEMGIINHFCGSALRLEDMKFEQPYTGNHIKFLKVIDFVFSITLFSIIYVHVWEHGNWEICIFIISDPNDMEKIGRFVTTTKHDSFCHLFHNNIAITRICL